MDRVITSASIYWPRTIATPSPDEFSRQIQGQRIRTVTRRAKYIHLTLSNVHLFVHLRMSGDLLLRPMGTPHALHDRVILGLSEPLPHAPKELVFNDARKFGRMWLTDKPEEVIGALGPEPLEAGFTAQALLAALHTRRRLLKPLLLDQTFIAGLGNIYTDEALHKSRLHPLRRSDSLQLVEAARLRNAIRSVLRSGIRRNGASIDWVYRGGDFQNHFAVYGRTGEKCRVCGARVRRMLVGQRGTHFCPRCQRH